MPRQVLLTTIGLCVVAAGLGFWLGQRQIDLSERVNAVAAEHVRRHGGNAGDCVGWVAPGEETIRVTCGEISYRISPWGRVTLQSSGI